MNRSELRLRSRQLVAFALLLGLTTLAAHAGSNRFAEPQLVIQPEPTPVIEVAFVLDTTGSMSGLIEGAKRKIWSIANQMASGQPTPRIRIGLIGYRDRGDAYVTRVFDLTSDIDAIYGQLQELEAGGGGDTPESVNQALREAVDRMSWSPGQQAYKVVFLVGDAPPHMDYANDTPYAESLRRARARGIVVNTVQCGSLASTTPIWQSIAQGGDGLYVAIRQDGGMVALATPHDEDLARLNRDLANTVVAWGNASEQAETLAKRQRALEAPRAAVASRLGYMAKNGGKVNSGREDLVDAFKEGSVDPRTLAETALPPELRALPPAEREAFVKDQLAEREKLQREIVALSNERDAWVRTEQKRLAAAGEADGFDQRVLGAIRTQAAAKGITY